MLKKILLGIVGIIALLLIAALFVDKDFSAQRSIVINKPKSEVFAYLKSLKNQDNWSVWGKRDPNMKK
ncbi:MAG: polyketide cyclase, partial [Chitinophagales bacterium]|nr:polyketide cyclase [Chitinophagales bacterium]